MTALAALSAALARQTLVIGRVSDAVSNRAIDDVALALAYDPVGTGKFTTLPAMLRRLGDGWFAFHLAPDLVRPADARATPTMRVSANAPGHGTAESLRVLDPTDLALDVEQRVIAGQPAQLPRLRGAPFRVDLALSPVAVALEGYVFAKGDSDRPVDGAQIAVVKPVGGATTQTDKMGFFRVVLPVAAEVTIAVTDGGEPVKHLVRPDFGRRINRAVFATA